MFLILFFMYVFPIIFLPIPVLRMTPIVATIFLILGVIFWTMNVFKILSFIRGPKKASKKLLDLQADGKLVSAKVIESKTLGNVEGYPYKNIKLEFVNLGGNPVETSMEVIDSKPHEERFEPGKNIELKLNRRGFDPAITINGAEYEVSPRPILWFWLFFHIAYAIGFFLVSYYFQNDGYGWRFLNPFHPWIWSPLATMGILKTFSELYYSDGLTNESDIQSKMAKKRSGELLLYGKRTKGEIISYNQTGLYVNEQPQIKFNVLFDVNGQKVNKEFKEIISLLEMSNLSKGEVEVLYLPTNPDVFTINF